MPFQPQDDVNTDKTDMKCYYHQKFDNPFQLIWQFLIAIYYNET